MRPERAFRLVVEDGQVPGEGVHLEDAGGAGDSERHIAPRRVSLATRPTRVYRCERAIGYDAALKLERKNRAIVDGFGPEEGPNLGVYGAYLDTEDPTQGVGDVDGVVHYRPAARRVGIQKPASWDPPVVSTIDREDATDGAGPHGLTRLPHRGEITHGEGSPELQPGLLTGSYHGLCVLDRRGDRLLAQHVHAALKRRYRVLCMLPGLGADNHRINRFEQQQGIAEEANAEPFRCCAAAG